MKLYTYFWKVLLIYTDVSLNKKWSFQLRISSVNVTKSAGNCGFGYIYGRNPQWKTSFFVQCIDMVSLFGRNPTQLHLILNETFNFSHTRVHGTFQCVVFSNDLIVNLWGHGKAQHMTVFRRRIGSTEWNPVVSMGW